MSLIFQSLLTPCLVSNRAEETGFSVDFLPVFCTFHYHTFSSGLLMAPFAQLATSVRGTFFYSLHHWPPPPFSNITWLFHTAFCYVSKITQLSQRFLLIILACWMDRSDLWGFAQQHGYRLCSSRGIGSISFLCQAAGFHTICWSLFTF